MRYTPFNGNICYLQLHFVDILEKMLLFWKTCHGSAASAFGMVCSKCGKVSQLHWFANKENK